MSNWFNGLKACGRYIKANLHRDLKEVAKEAHEKGYDIMMHCPHPMGVDTDKFEYGEGWVDYILFVNDLIKTSRTDILSLHNASVVELVDTADLKFAAYGRTGSSPVGGTNGRSI